MTDQEQQLRDALAVDEGLSPDPAAVYARVQELSTKYKRRRRTTQIAGGAVLGVGLATAAFNLPAALAGLQDRLSHLSPELLARLEARRGRRSTTEQPSPERRAQALQRPFGERNS